MISRTLFLLVALFCAACQPGPQTLTIDGQAMGSNLRVVVIDPSGRADRQAIELAIEETVQQVNSRFSNWHADSEVSRFNQAEITNPIKISKELQLVIEQANVIHFASEGLLDITLGPLVELWGFGSPGPRSEPPSDEAIAATLPKIGQMHVLTLDRDAGTLTKAFPDTEIYLAAIAKGTGIDAIAQTLLDMGFTDLMVEVGGDLVAFGNGPSGRGWRIGIERPDSLSRGLEEIVALSGSGMATSGDYRNYFEQDGVRYSHILDASTGRPITHSTASVTVLAATAAQADAWATALLALGSDRGLAIAEDQGLAALFINRSQDSAQGEFQHLATSEFADFLARKRD